MQTLLGVFTDKDGANSAVLDLENNGYNPKDISVIVKEDVSRSGIKGGRAASGAIAGTTTGAVIGGLTGLLIGIGAITIPGVGALLVGGPLAALLGLSGVAATAVSGATTGALAGGLVGTLVALGLPEEEAREYEKKISGGAVLLAVAAPSGDDVSNIRGIFERHNANQIRTIGGGE